MQTQAGKASGPTQDRTGAKRTESIDRPSLTAPHHNVENARLVGGKEVIEVVANAKTCLLTEVSTLKHLLFREVTQSFPYTQC
jgi:hypothetical protein